MIILCLETSHALHRDIFEHLLKKKTRNTQSSIEIALKEQKIICILATEKPLEDHPQRNVVQAKWEKRWAKDIKRERKIISTINFFISHINHSITFLGKQIIP